MSKLTAIAEHLQSVFQAPVAWRDYSSVLESVDHRTLSASVNSMIAFKACSIHNVRKARSSANRYQTKITVRDHSGAAMVCTLYGDAKALLHAASTDIAADGFTVLAGVLKTLGSTYLLCDPDHVPKHVRGKIIPLYPPKRGKRPVVRETPVTDAEINEASESIRQLAFAGVEDKAHLLLNVPYERSIEYFTRALSAVHRPTALDRAERASDALNRVGAWIAVKSVLDQHQHEAASVRSTPIKVALTVADLQARASMRLTAEQQTAIAEIATDVSRDTPMERLLSGDTGSGKTPVYGLAAIAAAHAGATVAVLCPSEYLARQVHRAIKSWAMDLDVTLCIGGGARQRGNIVVGTTAMLHDVELAPDIVIIDEQQAFGVEQRRALLSRVPGRIAHLLEVTATCVPRSQAIAEMGLLKVSRLTKCHVQKTVTTTHFDRHHGTDLFHAVRATIDAGGKVLVIYPAKAPPDPSEKAAKKDQKPSQVLFSVIKERANWEKHFKGRVGVVYGALTTDEAAANQVAIDSFSAGKLDVLLSTTVLERGVDIPELMHVVVMQPDRFGLAQLHQIRGRVARQGGIGRCDLYSPYPVSPTAMSRIKALMEHNDGWKIAAADLDDRGCGDISFGAHQHGDLVTPFSSLRITKEHLSEVTTLLIGNYQ